ncbi:hypothetical protein [Photobacterium leiognathi]|nr:hypothetical protein [Photobacterium leiognathi]
MKKVNVEKTKQVRGGFGAFAGLVISLTGIAAGFVSGFTSCKMTPSSAS